MMMIEPPFVMTRSPPSPCYLPVLPLMETDRQTQLQPGPTDPPQLILSTFKSQLSQVNFQMLTFKCQMILTLKVQDQARPTSFQGLHVN